MRTIHEHSDINHSHLEIRSLSKIKRFVHGFASDPLPSSCVALLHLVSTRVC